MYKKDSQELYRLCSSSSLEEQNEGYVQLGNILYSSLRRYSYQLDDTFIEDCTQNALLAIYQEISRNNGPNSPEAFIAWTVKIAKSKYLDAIRRTNRRATSSSDDLSEDEFPVTSSIEDIPEANALKTEIIETLTNRILSAPFLSKNAKIVLIQYCLGVADQELAEMLNTTKVNIKVIRSRALKKIRNDEEIRPALRELI